MSDLPAISSWSGGKDSCLACYRAIADGTRVDYLLNFISRESKRGCFHGIERELMKTQADLTGLDFVQREASSTMESYEEEFKAAVSELKKKGIGKMVFGDVYLDEHRDWVARVCGDLGIEPIEPLWNRPPEEIVKEFIGLGFKAVVVSCKSDILGEDFVGRTVDHDLLDELKARDICPCGENGEFHTLVTEGPLFKGKLDITRTAKVLKKGFWEYWFLDIQKWEIRQ